MNILCQHFWSNTFRILTFEPILNTIDQARIPVDQLPKSDSQNV